MNTNLIERINKDYLISKGFECRSNHKVLWDESIVYSDYSPCLFIYDFIIVHKSQELITRVEVKKDDLCGFIPYEVNISPCLFPRKLKLLEHGETEEQAWYSAIERVKYIQESYGNGSVEWNSWCGIPLNND